MKAALGTGAKSLRMCSPAGLRYGSQPGPGQVSVDSASAGSTVFELGTVGANVTRVVVQLSNGTELDLRPTLIGGFRWIAFAAPALTIQRAASYAGGVELQYAIPYRNAEFVAWLRPGQAGPRRARYLIGAGSLNGKSWSAYASVGPWGICLDGAGDAGDCVAGLGYFRPGGTAVNRELVCGPTGAAQWYGATAAPGSPVGAHQAVGWKLHHRASSRDHRRRQALCGCGSEGSPVCELDCLRQGRPGTGHGHRVVLLTPAVGVLG